MAEQTGTAKGYAGPEVTVTITREPNRTLAVDIQQLRLSKKKGDLAGWQLSGGGDFTLEFEDPSPFDRREYDQDTARNLPLRAGVDYRSYKYTVKVTGYPDLDPEVIVDQ